MADPGAPAVVVVIPARNAAATIGDQLAALAGQEYAGRWRVVVVDDGSADETSAIVEAARSRFPVELAVVHQDPGGASAARNAGVLATDEPLIVFCDADDEVAAGWLSALAAALVGADGAGGRLELARLNPPHLIAWAIEAQKLTLGWRTNHEWGRPSPIGACCGVTRRAWVAVGGFNELLPYPGEDTELFWRMQSHGMTIADAGDALVHYRLAATPRRLLAKLFRAGRVHTLLLRAYRHPKRRRQLLLEVAAAALRSPRVAKASTRPKAIHDLVWVAGRLVGLAYRGRGRIGPDVRQPQIATGPTRPLR